MFLKKTYPRTQKLLLGLQLFGDACAAFCGLSLAFALRFLTPLQNIGVDPGVLSYSAYLRLILLGTFFFLGSFAYLGLYSGRLLLRPHRSLSIVLRAIVFWMLAFLGTSLALKFEPSISRLFVAISCVTTFLVMIIWRMSFFSWLSRSSFRARIVQRVLVVGWSAEAEKLSSAIRDDRNHPYEVAGYLSTRTEGGAHAPKLCPRLGSLEDLENTLLTKSIDIVLVADFDLATDQLVGISSLCERLYVQFKIAPTFFRIFVSNLHLQTISGMPVLGIEELPVSSLVNSIIKRAIDIMGALIGLIISLPIMAIFAILIKREGPGPILPADSDRQARETFSYL